MQFLETNWAYAIILITSLLGLMLCDKHWKLIAWRNKAAKKATIATIAILVCFFLTWNAMSIILGIHYINPRFTLGINLITSNLPIEEILFLILLIYSVLIIDTAAKRYHASRHTL